MNEIPSCEFHLIGDFFGRMHWLWFWFTLRLVGLRLLVRLGRGLEHPPQRFVGLFILHRIGFVRHERTTTISLRSIPFRYR